LADGFIVDRVAEDEEWPFGWVKRWQLARWAG
jgi:hypothetical protein